MAFQELVPTVARLKPNAALRYTHLMPALSRSPVPPAAVGINSERALALAREVLATEAAAIRAIETRLGDSFVDAARVLLECRGRVVVTGIGKSGHIARKLAATLASTGTPAFFVHAAEASHGDLGMITRDDVVVLLSNSGETDELVSLLPHLKRQGARLIALTGYEESSLALAADVHLDASVDIEACPLGLAPTASTTATLALGDALALTLPDARGFSVADFARDRFGKEVCAYLAEPLLSGIYGGDAEKLSMNAVLPQFLQYEESHGNVVRGVIAADRAKTRFAAIARFIRSSKIRRLDCRMRMRTPRPRHPCATRTRK